MSRVVNKSNRKLCSRCGKGTILSKGKTYWYREKITRKRICNKCYNFDNRDQKKVYMKEYRKNNYKSIKKTQDMWRQKNIDHLREYRKEYLPKYIETHRQELRNYKNKWRQEAKILLMEILGGVKCKKCGYNKNIWGLQIDHINGGGTKERRDKFHHSSEAMYFYYLKHPKLARRKLQVLCALCNIEKRFMNGEVNQYSKKGRIINNKSL